MNSMFEDKANTVSFGQKLAASELSARCSRRACPSSRKPQPTSMGLTGGLQGAVARRLARLFLGEHAPHDAPHAARLLALLQRAVNEGEMTLAQASKEKHKVRLSRQDIATNREAFERLPAELRELTLQSLRLQERILHLDQLIYSGEQASPTPASTRTVHDQSVAAQFERLRARSPRVRLSGAGISAPTPNENPGREAGVSSFPGEPVGLTS